LNPKGKSTAFPRETNNAHYQRLEAFPAHPEPNHFLVSPLSLDGFVFLFPPLAEGFSYLGDIRGETPFFGRMKSSMVGIFLSFLILEGGKQKGSQEMQKSPRSLHLITLWETPFMICSRRLGIGQSGAIETGKKNDE
jgi:hypothetical protein